jgi:hypothetical protein
VSVFLHKTFFTTEQAACLLAGVATPKENYAEVNLWQEELERDFPPDRETVMVGGYSGNYRKEKVTPATFTREQLKIWCEGRGVFPAELFPENHEKPDLLHQNERRTLLAIIRALAQLHGINPDAGAYRKEAEALLKQLASKGIDQPCNDKTLAKHLAASFKER